MSPDNAKNERNALQQRLRLHRTLNIGLLTTSLVTLVMLCIVSFRERVFVVPPEVRRPYALGAAYASEDYLLDMAGYVLGMVLTVTPESVDHNNGVILRMTDPNGYASLKTALDAAALRLKAERVTTIWEPKKTEVSSDTRRVIVTGRLKTYVTDTLTSEREKEYIVDFHITTSGRLFVSGIQERVKPASAVDA